MAFPRSYDLRGFILKTKCSACLDDFVQIVFAPMGKVHRAWRKGNQTPKRKSTSIEGSALS